VGSDPQRDGDDDDPVDRRGDADSRGRDVTPDFAASETSAEPDFSDVDPDLLNRFVVTIVLIKAGIILVSIGMLVVGFRGHLELGGAIMLVGVLAFLRAGYNARSHRRATPTEDQSHQPPDDTQSNESTTTPSPNAPATEGRNR